MKDMNLSKFDLDLDTKVTTNKIETVTIKLQPDIILTEYAQAYIYRMECLNPLKAKEVGLTDQELIAYFTGLLAIRVEAINGRCKVWREAKQLYVPVWIESCLAGVGVVEDLESGLEYRPSYSTKYDINNMMKTSSKLHMFTNDGLQLTQNAIGNDVYGSEGVMTTVITNDGYLSSRTKLTHTAESYVSAFLGNKLDQTKYEILFRVKYDDIQFVKRGVLNCPSLI